MTLNLTDENFKKEIQNAEKPVLVDFWSAYCLPCFLFFPVLEKLAEEYKDKVIFAKLNINQAPLTAREYEIDRIPIVFLFKEGKPVAGFMGAQPEEVIREWLEKNLIIEDYREYAKKNGFELNPNKEAVERLIRGLLENEKKFGKRYCPCRRITGIPEEDLPKICPCDFMRAEIEQDGHCYCGLFVKS